MTYPDIVRLLAEPLTSHLAAAAEKMNDDAAAALASISHLKEQLGDEFRAMVAEHRSDEERWESTQGSVASWLAEKEAEIRAKAEADIGNLRLLSKTLSDEIHRIIDASAGRVAKRSERLNQVATRFAEDIGDRAARTKANASFIVKGATIPDVREHPEVAAQPTYAKLDEELERILAPEAAR